MSARIQDFKRSAASSRDLKSISVNFQYAATLSEGIAAWLLASERHITGFANIAAKGAYWLPFLLTSLLGGLALATNSRLRFKGTYLRNIEDALGFSNLGWEKKWSTRPPFGSGAMYHLLWSVLVLADLLLGLGSVFGLYGQDVLDGI